MMKRNFISRSLKIFRRIFSNKTPRIGVFYLARGADENAFSKFEMFRDSYLSNKAGIKHELFVIAKGFDDMDDLNKCKNLFNKICNCLIDVEDEGYDITAYFAAALKVRCDIVCFVNTGSKICVENWLYKLFVNLNNPEVAAVGCTGSFEAPMQNGMEDIVFPNPHLRTNAFMLRQDLFISLKPANPIVSKHDAYLFEHGPRGLTRRLVLRGWRVLLVGRDGRGYDICDWAISDTFRQKNQQNLLVSDNQTMFYQSAAAEQREFLRQLAWGSNCG